MSVAPYDEANLALHVGDDPDAVLHNRDRVAERLGAVRLVWAEQVHGADVGLVSDEDVPATGWPGVDALVTAQPGVALGVLVADCMPVVLLAADAGVVAVAHAGRKGLLAGVLERTVAVMADAGANPAGVVAVVGPCIGACCYELPADVVAAGEELLPGTAATTRGGTPAMDLRAGADVALSRAGVSRVTHVGGCTVDRPGQWFSYRRDGVTGRMAGVVVRSVHGVGGSG